MSDSVSGDQLYTPGDNTDGAGFVDVVVPAGTYDFDICPQFADQLVATTLVSQVVTGNVFLGTLQLANGVVLSGNVKDTGGTPQAGIDLDMKVSGTGAKITLCGDNTDSAGNYAVVVPTGTFDLEFEPPAGSPFCATTVFNVSIAGNTTQNATLGQGATVYCTSKPSSVPGCVPSILAPCTASLSGGSGSANVLCGPVPGGSQPGILVYTTNGPAASPVSSGFGFLCITTGAGFFRVVPPAVPGGSNGTCSGSYTFDFGTYLAGPNGDAALVPGASIDTQAWYRDPTNPGSANFSNAAGFTLVP